MIRAIIYLAFITLIPALELRASIPVGIFTMQNTLSWPLVAGICILVNILLGWFIYQVLGPIFVFIRKWHWFNDKIWPYFERTRHKIHPFIEKYGELGVAFFIGIPLPGSGVYTGAFGAYLLGMDKKKFLIANILGVSIAAIAITALCLLILYGIVAENSWMARLLLKTQPH